MKDKLIELLSENFVDFCHVVMVAGNCKISAVTLDADKFAECLIANGVTFAEDNNVPCKYCEEYADLPEHFVDGKPVGRVFDTCIQHDGVGWHLEPASSCDIGIKYCPMCGRRLPEPPKEGE